MPGQQHTGRRPPPQPPKPPVQINPNTTVSATPASGGYSATRRNRDGSQTTMTTTSLPNGRTQVSGFTSRTDQASGATTRTYTDGSRVTAGRDFVRHQTASGYSETIHRDGRREGRWRDGRRMYHDEYHHRRHHDGRTERFIKRAVVATLVAGALVALAAPLIQEYNVEPVNGVETYTYQPVTYDPPVYQTVYQPLPAPIPVVVGCVVCPPPVVVYQQPVVAYQEPAVLLTDLQIATAMNDGMAVYAPPPMAAGQAPDPQVQALAAEVASLQQEVASAAATNDALKGQLAEQQVQLADQQAQTAGLQAQVGAEQARQVQISEEVRQQIRQQVLEEIALHQQKKPLTLTHVMTSAHAQNYIFQISGMIEAADLSTNEPVVLTTGDLIKFYQVPGEGEVAAQMMVVTSKSPAVRPGSVVMIGLTDLQEMLNAFSQRLEQNMKKVADHAAAPQR
ncbi:MAG: hypothetical protein HY910_00690 [Desulfarculus sp.]|nr:hypothetical protein [Desulfarculus sp.]